MRASIVPMVLAALLFLACNAAFAAHFSLGCFVTGVAGLTALRAGQVYRRAGSLDVELRPRDEISLAVDSLAVAVQLAGLPSVACLIVAFLPLYGSAGEPGLFAYGFAITLGLGAALLIAGFLRPRLWPYELPEPAKKRSAAPAFKLAEWYETTAP